MRDLRTVPPLAPNPRNVEVGLVLDYDTRVRWLPLRVVHQHVAGTGIPPRDLGITVIRQNRRNRVSVSDLRSTRGKREAVTVVRRTHAGKYPSVRILYREVSAPVALVLRDLGVLTVGNV